MKKNANDKPEKSGEEKGQPSPEEQRQAAYDALGDRKVRVPSEEELQADGVSDAGERKRLIARSQFVADQQAFAPDLDNAGLRKLGEEFDAANPEQPPGATPPEQPPGATPPNVAGAAAPAVEDNRTESQVTWDLIMEGFDLLRVQTGHAEWPGWQDWKQRMLAMGQRIAGE